MFCTKCGSKTHVLDSRRASQKKLSKMLNLDWFNYRKRRCVSCGEEMQTVELLLDDVVELSEKKEVTIDDAIWFLQELKEKR